MKYLALVFVASTTVSGAFAQTAPVATAETAAPSHNCARPEIVDTSKKFTENQMSAFVAAVSKFKACAEAFAQGNIGTDTPQSILRHAP